jgi:gamma-glutamylcysteine synthetase
MGPRLLRRVAAVAAHETLMAKWKRRERDAKRRTGYAQASRELDKANRRVSEIARALRDTTPTSFEGLKLKAAVAEALDDDPYFDRAVAENLAAFVLKN